MDMHGLWVGVGVGAGRHPGPTVLCLLFLFWNLHFFPGRGEARFPSGEEGRQKREIKTCHRCLVNTACSAEQGLSRTEGLRERQGQRKGGQERWGEEVNWGEQEPLPQGLGGVGTMQSCPGVEKNEKIGLGGWKALWEGDP